MYGRATLCTGGQRDCAQEGSVIHRRAAGCAQEGSGVVRRRVAGCAQEGSVIAHRRVAGLWQDA